MHMIDEPLSVGHARFPLAFQSVRCRKHDRPVRSLERTKSHPLNRPRDTSRRNVGLGDCQTSHQLVTISSQSDADGTAGREHSFIPATHPPVMVRQSVSTDLAVVFRELIARQA